jgi:putative colanic acid biosynthesis glycosyltransferase
MVKISIITVCRDDRVGLENTFASIRGQDCDDFEWWVIDGKSADGTVEWLRENHRFDGGWISEPDNGIYDAMNKGIDLATGDYLLFMNSGDLLAGSDVISKLIDCITHEIEVPDFVYGDSLDIEANGRTHYRQALRASFIKVGMITRHQSMLYRKESVFHERYPANFKLSGDYALTANLLMKNGIKVLKVNSPVSLFSLGGRHDTLRLRALREDFKIRKTILQENLVLCILLFCVHWLHHHIRVLTPSLNKRFIYKRSRRV